MLWRKQVQPRWREYQWVVIGGIWLGVLYLGYVGFTKHAAAQGESPSPSDILYLTLQLIPMNSGAVSGPVSWELEAARLLIPALAAYTLIRGLALLFREQVQLARLRFIRDHVVICGLSRKGFLLAKGFRERGDKVVIIEREEDNDLLEQCRARGAIVVNGDATDVALLRQAAGHRAKCLVAVCGEDGTNAEVAVRAQELAADRKRGALTCIIHIVDPQLCDLLREREICIEQSSPFRLELFNVFDRGARLLLQEFPAFNASGEGPGHPPHLLVVGLGGMGESLVIRAARDWWDRHPPTEQQLHITVIDREAKQRCTSLIVRYPQLASVCDLVPCEMEIHSPEFQEARFLYDSQRSCNVDIVYVCLDDDSLGLHAGLTLLQRMRQHHIPIVVRMIEDAGLASLLRAGRDGKGAFQNLHAFGLLDRTCTADLVLGGTHEFLARLVHEEYRRREDQAGQTPQTSPAMVPWDSLSEDKRESNRRQVDHIGTKLETIGCGIARLTNWDAASFPFTGEEIEVMARMEHERWCEEQRRDRWTYAPGPKDPEKKTHPDLVSWEALPDPEKEKNRNTVRELPGFLARAGFQIYRWR
jgi:hypothetical protein